MGYETFYNLRARGDMNENVAKRIDDELRKRDIIAYALDLHDQSDTGKEWFWPGCDWVKWYEHENDMLAISQEFPDVTFCLDGDGEESDDM